MPYRPGGLTHDRGGSALIGAGALALLAGDLVYVGIRWHGHDRFDRGFLVGFVVLMAVGLPGKALGLGKPIGPDRKKARYGGHATTGVLFGEVAAVSGHFVVYTGWWVARHQRPSRSA